jgi:hypothetical protein
VERSIEIPSFVVAWVHARQCRNLSDLNGGRCADATSREFASQRRILSHQRNARIKVKNCRVFDAK